MKRVKIGYDTVAISDYESLEIWSITALGLLE